MAKDVFLLLLSSYIFMAVPSDKVKHIVFHWHSVPTFSLSLDKEAPPQNISTKLKPKFGPKKIAKNLCR